MDYQGRMVIYAHPAYPLGGSEGAIMFWVFLFLAQSDPGTSAICSDKLDTCGLKGGTDSRNCRWAQFFTTF